MTADTDWPVAEIPTSIDGPTHPTGIFMPLRWPHHGDLRILVHEDTILLAAPDVHALAEYDTDEDLHPTITPTVWWRQAVVADLVPMYTLADAVSVLEHTPTHQTAELLAWMRGALPDVLDDEVLDGAIKLDSFLDSYTVAQAALILDRDPAVSIGQRSLFRHLEHIGWATRHDDGHWEPTRHAHRGHWLTIREVLIRAGTSRRPYPQLYITPAGLTQLRRTLHALHPIPQAPATETLPIDV